MGVPGVDYAPLGSTKPLSNPQTIATVRAPSRRKKYEQNLALIQQAEDEYARQAQMAAEREMAGKKKPPLWQKAVGLGLKGLQYTSASEWAYKIPGIGDDIQSGVEKVPGLRTFLGAATSPLTYLAPGVGGAGMIGAQLSGRAAIAAGLASAAGAGLGEAALSEEGLGLDIPGVSEKYEGMVGGIAGGVAGMGGAGRVMARGLGASKFGQVAQVERAELLRMAKQRVKQGHLNQGDVVWQHPDNGRLFFVRPDDVDDAGRITLDDLLGPRPDIDQFAKDLDNTDFVYTSASRDDAMRVSSAGLGKTNVYQNNVFTVRPDRDVLMRVPRAATATDDAGQVVGRQAISSDNIQVLRSDGEWTSLRNLGVEDTRIPWKEHLIENPDEYVHDGVSWRLKNAEDAAEEAEEAVPLTLDAPRPGSVVPPAQQPGFLEDIARGEPAIQREMPMPGMRFLERPAAEAVPEAPVAPAPAPEGMQPRIQGLGQSVDDFSEVERRSNIAQDFADSPPEAPTPRQQAVRQTMDELQSDILRDRAEFRSFEPGTERTRWLQNRGAQRSMEQLAIDEGQMSLDDILGAQARQSSDPLANIAKTIEDAESLGARLRSGLDPAAVAQEFPTPPGLARAAAERGNEVVYRRVRNGDEAREIVEALRRGQPPEGFRAASIRDGQASGTKRPLLERAERAGAIPVFTSPYPTVANLYEGGADLFIAIEHSPDGVIWRSTQATSGAERAPSWAALFPDAEHAIDARSIVNVTVLSPEQVAVLDAHTVGFKARAQRGAFAGSGRDKDAALGAANLERSRNLEEPLESLGRPFIEEPIELPNGLSVKAGDRVRTRDGTTGTLARHASMSEGDTPIRFELKSAKGPLKGTGRAYNLPRGDIDAVWDKASRKWIEATSEVRERFFDDVQRPYVEEAIAGTIPEEQLRRSANYWGVPDAHTAPADDIRAYLKARIDEDDLLPSAQREEGTGQRVITGDEKTRMVEDAKYREPGDHYQLHEPDGKPQEVTLYHGTRNPELSTTDLEPQRPPYEGSLGEGIYFGEDAATADYYGPNLHQVKVRVENPLVIDSAEGTNYRPAYDVDTGEYNSILVGERVAPFDVKIGDEWIEIRSGRDLEDIGSMAREAGHDAVVARGLREHAPYDEVLVFDKKNVLPERVGGEGQRLEPTLGTPDEAIAGSAGKFEQGDVKMPTGRAPMSDEQIESVVGQSRAFIEQEFMKVEGVTPEQARQLSEQYVDPLRRQLHGEDVEMPRDLGNALGIQNRERVGVLTDTHTQAIANQRASAPRIGDTDRVVVTDPNLINIPGWKELADNVAASAYARPVVDLLERVQQRAQQGMQRSIYASDAPLADRVDLMIADNIRGQFIDANIEAPTIVVNPVTELKGTYTQLAIEGIEATEEAVNMRLAQRMARTTWHENVHSMMLHRKVTDEDEFDAIFNEVVRANPELYTESVDDALTAIQEMRASGAFRELEDHVARTRNADTLAQSADVSPRVRGLPEGRVQRRVEQAGTGRDVPEGADLQPAEAGRAAGRDQGGVRTGEAGRPGEVAVPAARTVERQNPFAASGDGAGAGASVRRVAGTGQRTDDPGAAAARSRVVERPDTPKREPRKINDAGPGTEFEAPLPQERIVPEARNFQKFSEELFAENRLRDAGQQIAEAHPALKRLVEVTTGPASTAVKDFQKKVVAYSARAVTDRDRLTAAIAHLRQGKRPFTQFENDLTRVTSWRGNEVTVPLGDVISNPKNFQLTAAQKGWVDRYHRIVDELVADAKADGVDIHELGFAKRGEFYVPRKVVGKGDIEKDAAYTKSGVGTKQTFQRTRYHMSMAEGAREGVVYADSIEALEDFGRAITKAQRDKLIVNELKAIGRTGKELAGPEVQAARDAAAKELRDARRALSLARREAGGEKIRSVEVNATQKGRKLSKVELRAEVEADGHVVSARESLTKAKNDLNFAKQKLANAKGDKTKARWGEAMEDAQKRIDAARDELADARNNARAQAKEVNTGQREFRVDDAKTRLQSAQQRLREAQARFDEVRGNAARTRRETGQIIRREGAAFAQDARKFGLPDTGDIKVRQVRNLPGLQGRLFPDDVAEYIEKGLTEQGTRALTKVSNVNDLARVFRTSTDFGALFIQGLPVLARRPDVWAKAAAMSIRSFLDPEYLQKFYVAKSKTLQDMADYVGGLSNNEYFAAAQREGLLAAAARSDVLALKGVGKGVERFSVSFDAFLDGSKIMMWEAMAPYMKTAADKEAFGRFIRNMTGTTSTARLGVSPTQRQVESLLMFSPRFTRSVFALAAQALEKGAAGNQARRSLAQMIGGAAVFYAGVKMAVEGKMPSAEDYNPAQGGRFMSIKVGDNYVGIGGAVRSAVQLLGMSATAAVTDPSRFLSTDTTSLDESNPFLKWARGRTSPVTGSVIDRLTGGPVVGEEYESNMDWISRLPDQFMPFAAGSWDETSGGGKQKLGILGAQMVGLRTFPESKSEDFNLRVQDVVKDMSGDGFSANEKREVEGWHDLTIFQKTQLLAKHPELREQLDEKERANWNEYDDIRQQAEDAKRSLGERLTATRRKMANGETLTVDDLTPKQYRDTLAKLEDRRRGALAQLQGANVFSGLGGEEPGAFSSRTHRQQVMDAYYRTIREAEVVDPLTGEIDFNAKDEAENAFLAQLTEADRKIIEQERGAAYDPVERELRVAKKALAPYWEINDQVARSLGFENAQDVALNGSPAEQRRYNKIRTRMKERMRRDSDQIDSLLVDWGYVTKPQRSGRRTVVRFNPAAA